MPGFWRTYGGGSVKNRRARSGSQRLNGIRRSEFGGIGRQTRPYETLMNAVKIAREQNVTFLPLAVGGGSVLDGTKFIAAAAQSGD